MKISDFRAKFENRFNGPARPNLFYVVIEGGASAENLSSPSDLTAFCKSTTLPGINLKTFEYSPRNYGMTQTLPYSINAEPLNCTFMLDSSHIVLSYFHNWMQRVVNYNSSNMLGTSTINSKDYSPFELGYLSDYSTTMHIYFFSSDNVESGDKYVMTLYDVFPTNVSSLNLSWDDDNSIATMPVSFSYSHFTVSAAVDGSGTAALDRMRSQIDGIYLSPGRNMYNNDGTSSNPFQIFLDLETTINQAINSETRRLLQRLF